MLTEFSNEVADVVAAAAPSIVQVQGRRRPASGLVYANQVVLTTLGAIKREDGLKVRQHDGHVADAELKGWDPATGLAVLRAASLNAPPIEPSGAQVRVGHFAIAVARSWTNVVTASAGIVAVIGGPLQTGPRRAIDQIFRTTAPMHDGFAGAAFLDTGGGLIGIATATTIRGLGVVIPSSIAWKAAASVLEHGRVKRGYLGLAGQPVALPEHQRGGTGREHGVLVLEVTPGGPAALAGMLVGDVLLAFDDTPFESPEELLDLLMMRGAGDHARLQLLRGAAPIAVTATLGERPAR